MNLRSKRINLNWDKLLGFSQVKHAERRLKSKSDLALVRAKVGLKTRGIKSVT
jgi:hypothetical protein